METLSLCITNYNRCDMLLESFSEVLKDERVSEIVISDDCSKQSIYNKVKSYTVKNKKIKLFRNENNVGMAKNKMLSVKRAENDYAIVFDSDNKISSVYIDGLYRVKWRPKVILAPSFAKPEFDYRQFSGDLINAQNIKHYMGEPMFQCFLNTCNYFVNRDEYLQTFVYDQSIKASDTIHFNYLWLKRGGCFQVVPQMEYEHRVHSGSGFLQDAEYNLRKAEQFVNLIKQL